MSRRYLLRSLSLIALAGAGLTLLVLLRHQPELPVRVRWSPDLTTDSRPALERRYSLTDPKQAEDRVWSYRLRDRSIENVVALLADPHVEDTAGIDRHTAVVVGVREDTTPPRATNPAWARLRAPRPQSYGCLILGTILLALARAKSRRWRLQGLIVALAAFLLMAISFPLPTNLDGDHDSWMGDFSLYVQDRGQFEAYTGNERVFFPSHLASVVVGFLDGVMGSTPASPSIAFLVLSWTATAVLALELLLLAALDGFSAPAIRYAGLCLAAPAALSFVGYRELGQLSLDVALFPLLMRALRRADAESSGPLIGASLVQGVRSALHGFGYVALAGATLAVVIEPARLRLRVSRGGTVLAYGLAASFVWLALYLLVLKRPVYPGHAELTLMRHSGSGHWALGFGPVESVPALARSPSSHRG